MSANQEFYVVGIGASAGGLDAVQQFFSNMDNESGIAFIVVQHLSPDFKSLMPELLAKYTKMNIYTATNNQEIRPNCIYLNQRNKNLIVRDNKLFLIDKASKEHLNLPIDIFFHSLGEEFKERSIGVILSGTGSDGSRGIKTIKENGGTILVQDPETAQFDGMPKSAIYTNFPDFILSPQEIAKRILSFTQKTLNILPELTKESEIETIYRSILTEIFNFSGVDFKKYKNNTLVRRLEKRMSLHNFNKLDDYYRYLKENESEKNALKQEFLIGVTSFFRDKEAFQILSKQVIPEIFQSKKGNDVVRIWVPGCSTGEEAYSIAILCDRYIRDTKSNIDFKIFATDIDKRALEKANIGSYPVNNFAEIDKNFFEDYFFKTGDQIQIIKRIREKIVFSLHDLTSDPPFIRLDLISCRNLLIYLTNETQKKVIDIFQYALNKGGFLFLGSSESLGINTKHFKTIDSKWKIFQNTKENLRSLIFRSSDDNHLIRRYEDSLQGFKIKPQKMFSNKQNEAFFYKFLSRKHSPVSVFIDSEFNVLFIQGNFKKWYNQFEGLHTNNLLNMVSNELASVIRNSIRQVKEKGKSLSIEKLLCKVGDEQILTNLYFEIADIFDSNEDIFLIQFGEAQPSEADEKIVLSSNDFSEYSKQRIEELENELKETRTELQNVIEELEASNEELQSANEELMSSNEELQSANEELQSVNEELYTVNTEFQEKNKELTNLNNDITNLLNSIDVGTLYLDKDLNIRKFTNEIKRVFKLEESDIGRSIVAFASAFPDNVRQYIISEAKNALENLVSSESEIQDSEGNWYLKRVKPYITADKVIEGVIITFIQMNNLKKATDELRRTEMRLSLALDAGKIAWWEMELPSGNIVFSRNKAEMLGYLPEDFKHYEDFMKIVHPDDYENTMNAMRDLLKGLAEVYECDYRIKNSIGEYQWFHDVGRVTYKQDDYIIVSGVVREITHKKKLEFGLQEALKKAESANNYKLQLLSNMSHEIRTPINAIIGFTSLLKEDNLDQQTKEQYISIIENSSNQLLNLINDIIEVSKIEAGELKISISNCHLGQLFKDIETTYKQLKKRKNKENIEITAHIPTEYKRLVIKTDPSRLQQVINNLLDNALKFTEEGNIDFGFSIENKKLKIYVKDTGIGIPSDKFDAIFERFQRLEHPDSAKYDGTGLGLSITKGIVQIMGGEIQVESELGKGSTFTIFLPFDVAEDEYMKNEFVTVSNIEALQNINVLIVEDDPVNIIFFKEMIKSTPVNTFWAENGAKAVEIYKNNKIDLVFMDIRMPVMDGFKAIGEILKINPTAKVIAQTAYALIDEKQKCFELGFCDYITKPIKKEVFLSKLEKWAFTE